MNYCSYSVNLCRLYGYRGVFHRNPACLVRSIYNIVIFPLTYHFKFLLYFIQLIFMPFNFILVKVNSSAFKVST